MAWNSPAPLARVLEVIQRLQDAPLARVLDVGCGTGELLAALAARGAQAVGIELDEGLARAARLVAPGARIEARDAGAAPLPDGFDLVACLGASHAFGAGPGALTSAAVALAAAAKPGGYVLVGEGFQRQPLPAEYAAFLGEPNGIERTHAENVLELERHGLDVVHAITASEAEWDEFEWDFYRRRGQRVWRDAWLRSGRATMGFGVYLARRSPQP
ncbi:MAG: methyltransferase domain-containing protein [Planctomycetota bacterium]